MLVTGAAGGIGERTCSLLHRVGAQVIAADLAGAGPCPDADERVTLDVTDDEAVDRVVGGLGPLDGLILSHGVTSLGPAVGTPMAAVDRVLAVNLRGAIAVTQAALPGLIQRRGRIVVLSSVAGFAPLVHRTAYAASKHGIHGYFESLRSEVSGSGVSVTIVAPSFVATGIELRAAHRAGAGAGARSTAGEVLSPDVVARAIVEGMARRRSLVLPSRTARAAYALSRVAPGMYARTMRRKVLGPG
ncbi:MAG TPA: SDR family NAD(P)-dependent oxidoreductase [Motilibacterales bacterium]|nr:SDR family NAD(P)-dependent oxidoreductase [Motilibacterales bacterium]